MGKRVVLFAPAGEAASMHVALNERLSAVGISLMHADVLMIAGQRAESLAELERVEFGRPAVVAIAEAIASSPILTRENAADMLASLQGSFYELRDELPVDVPDTEIIEALRSCLDEVGDAAKVAAMPIDELMAHSREYLRALDAQKGAEYRIVDEEGRAYTFDSSAWDCDETAQGWDGERWSDDWVD